MRIGKTALAVLFLVLAASSQSSFAAQVYKVSTTLSHDGKVFGAPAVVVKADTDASVAVSGPHGYKLRLCVTDADDGKLKISTQLNSAYGTISPTMVVFAGKPAMVSVGSITIDITASRGGS